MKPLDRDAIRFRGSVIRVAMGFGGSINDEGAGDYADRLYKEFKNCGSTDAESWLQDRMSSAFQHFHRPPVWVESEPAWAFHNGEPMVFISQVDMTENEITATALGYDQTVYFFGCRVPLEDGFALHYEARTQIRGLA